MGGGACAAARLSSVGVVIAEDPQQLPGTSHTPPAAAAELEKRPGCFGRVFFGAAGVFFVFLAIIAAIVPLIPAPPFFLAAVGCFAKSSPRFKNWLVNNKWFGPYFGGEGDPKAFTAGGKALALLILWAVALILGLFVFDGLFWRCGLVMTVITFTIYIILLKPPKRPAAAARDVAALGPPPAAAAALPADVGAALAACGFYGSCCSNEHLRELRLAIDERRRAGDVAPEIDGEYSGAFDFAPPADFPGARSLVVVGYPSPPVAFTFGWRGKKHKVLVPPTYLKARETDGRAEEVLAAALGPRGYRVAKAVIPKKLLAVRCGLAVYGRNNITYIPGMGSYYRIAAFHSDYPCVHDSWGEARALARCERCTVCMAACPTGAIARDRFLVRAERCLTYFNELSPETPFPSWIDPAWQECIVGCLKCQAACPENRAYRGRITAGPSFSEKETALLLAGRPLAELPAATAAKLKESGLDEVAELLPRNLGLILGREG